MGEEAETSSSAGVGPAAQQSHLLGLRGLGKDPLLLEVQLEPHAGLCCCGRHLDSPQGLSCRSLGRAKHKPEVWQRAVNCCFHR